MQLACKEERKVSQTGKCEAAVTAGETAPSILQGMRICLCADIDRHQEMLWSAFLRLASSNEIRSRSPNCILDDIREDGRKGNADQKTEDCDVSLVYFWSYHQCPGEEEAEWYSQRVDDVHVGWDALDKGVGVLDVMVIEGEHSVEWGDEGCDLRP